MGHAKKSSIHVGLFAIPVRLEVAVDDDNADTHRVCTGMDGKPHAPSRVKMHVDCPECGRSHSSVFPYTQRGVERDGKLVVLTEEEVKAAAGEPVKQMSLSFHSREKVYAATVAGGSVQNVYPDKGGENGYKALRDALVAHGDVVAVTVWAPSTKNALWVLEVVDERIVASKRAWPEDVRPAPAIAPGTVTEVEAMTLNMLLESSIRDFDLGEYRNAAKQGMADLIASRFGDAVAAPAKTSSGPVASGDMLSALQASLDALKPAKPKATKAPAKKAAAKKAPAKKTAAKRPAKKSAAA